MEVKRKKSATAGSGRQAPSPPPDPTEQGCQASPSPSCHPVQSPEAELCLPGSSCPQQGHEAGHCVGQWEGPAPAAALSGHSSAERAQPGTPCPQGACLAPGAPRSFLCQSCGHLQSQAPGPSSLFHSLLFVQCVLGDGQVTSQGHLDRFP